MSQALVSRDVFIRLTHPTTKKSIVNQHRVWDLDRFLASQVEHYDGTKTREDERRLVTVATAEEYRTFRKGARA
ncbi:hypothetical protein [Achromobacter aloeverae]